MTAKKVLVTGGAGFIGSHLVDGLIDEGHEVTILDNLEPQVHQGKTPKYLNPEAEFRRGDVRNKDLLKELLENHEIVFHYASAVGVGQSMYKIQKYVDYNTLATAKLLDVLVNEDIDIEKLILPSSMTIYGEGTYKCSEHGVIHPGLRPEHQLKKKEWKVKCPYCSEPVEPVATEEDRPLNPNSIYAITKKNQEEMVLQIGKTYGIPTVAFRFFNVYGSRRSLSNPYTGVTAIFSSRIKNDNPPLIFEDGQQTRDFIHVIDAVRANILAMNSSNANYEYLNVGSGEPVTIFQIAETLIKLYGKYDEVEPEITGKYRTGDIRHCYADTSKIKSKLDFEPDVSLKEGLEELVKWGREVEAEDDFEKSKKELEEKNLLKS